MSDVVGGKYAIGTNPSYNETACFEKVFCKFVNQVKFLLNSQSERLQCQDRSLGRS